MSVTSLTATLLMYRYKVRSESKVNAVFDSWISLKILCSKDTVLFARPTNFDGFNGK